MDASKAARVSQALEKFRIELPSWGLPIPVPGSVSFSSQQPHPRPKRNLATPARYIC